jgi:polyphosphate kinase
LGSFFSVDLIAGNYNPLTSRVYTDLSLLTANSDITKDAADLFLFMTSARADTDAPVMTRLAFSPLTMRQRINLLIAGEIANKLAGKPAGIWAKMNALEDEGVIEELYAASRAGVPVDLVVRGVCCLRPGVPGLSENIRVKSVVGRFLEHHRISVFANGAALPSSNANVFMSSADWMTRNLDRRIEVLVPLESDATNRYVAEHIMQTYLKDSAQSWVLQSDGEYIRSREVDSHVSAEEIFMRH